MTYSMNIGDIKTVKLTERHKKLSQVPYHTEKEVSKTISALTKKHINNYGHCENCFGYSINAND